MRSMAIDRRHFLALSAVLGLHPGRVFAQDSASIEPRYLAARKRAGRDEAVVLNGQGHDCLSIAMPARGHSFAIDAPRERAVVFGRQPGFFALAFPLSATTPPKTLPLPQDRHFFGHGVYRPDGGLLFATENDFEAGRGVVGVYDASPGGDYRRVGEFDSAGIGPHEIVLLPDGKTLCVANGGILTHPDYGKLELNLDTMRPSLVYLDAASGALLEQVELEPALHRLSIRHLAVAADGSVWFGCQYSGAAQDQPALVGRHRRGHALELFRAPDAIQRGFRGYVGSLAVDASGTVLAASSPVGGQLVYWDTRSGRYLGMTPLADGCGVASQGVGRFLFNSGQGRLLSTGPGRPDTQLSGVVPGLAWDNHLRRV